MEKNGKNDVGKVGFLKSEIFSNFFLRNWVKFDAEFNGNGFKSLLPHLHCEKIQN